MPISITPWLRMLLGTTLLVQVGYGQDLEQLKNLSLKKTLKQGITLSGSLTGNNVYYRANGRTDRTVPVNLLYTGNLSVDILGKVNMPVTFSFSNQDVNFTHPFDRAYQFRQPFNRLLLKPTYKGFTLHLGTCAMHFSPYTLAGHRFDGVGLDYKSAQRPFYASAMVGNLQRAVRIDTSQQLIGNNLPSYKRIGAGLQLGYRHKEDLVELIVFGAADKRSSLPYSLDERNILPQQNAVVSLKASKQLFQTILLNTELAFSGITNDSRAPANDSRTNLVTSFLGTFTPRTSTDYRKAVRVEALYRGKTLTAGLAYSRIDPNYRTLGAYYFANDLETLDGKLATQLLQGKLTLSGNLGVQQDNVLRQNLKTNRRLVGMANVSWVPSQKLNVLLNYSSFTAFSNLLPVYDYLRQVTPYDALDTLNFRQINQNAMLLATLVLPTASSDISRTLTLNTTLQRGDSRQGSSAMSNNLTNLSLDYSQANTTRRISLNGSVNVSRYAFYGSPTTQWGPSLTLMKGVGPNWRTTLTGLYAWSSTTGLAPIDEQSLSARWGLTGQPGKQTTLMLNLIYFNRTASSTERPANAFSEFTATLGMAYRFTLLSLH